MRKRLNDEAIAALAPKRKRYLVYDSLVPGLAVRVSPKGKKTFVMVARFKGSKHPTRRSLGALGRVTLERAREKAQAIQRDPCPSSTDTFGQVTERYFQHIERLRRYEEVERAMRRELYPKWENKVLSSIIKRDVIEAIDALKARGKPSAAHHLFADIRRFFNYAVARDIIDHSPCDRLKPSILIGPKGTRHRVLDDDEIKRLWAASEQIGFPYGPLWQLLLITGQRRGEVAHARWSEFDLEARLWTVPAKRFKSGSTHIVPLTQMAIDILRTLPRDSDLVFGHVNGFSKAKSRLDKAMGDPAPFVTHDIRRTVRTRLSSLRVPYEVAEMVIGHGKKGLARVYDQHHYLPEMRDALERWETSLGALVDFTTQLST